ncbi:MAG: dephospho-CoA kinase [Duncaniella sp.]|nr:dephospho-CoA kinase [Duncaniella sp.]
MSKKLIAITGGIGSGKSVVSSILRSLGYEVYDCDSRAKINGDSDYEIKAKLVSEISPDCVDSEGNVRRDRVAEIVFANPDALNRLNLLTHAAVRDDIRRQAAISENNPLFVETAILYQSELDLMVDEVWVVKAPEELRIGRVMERNGLEREQVIARIESQDGYKPQRRHAVVRELVNDEILPLLPQVEELLKNLVPVE